MQQCLTIFVPTKKLATTGAGELPWQYTSSFRDGMSISCTIFRNHVDVLVSQQCDAKRSRAVSASHQIEQSELADLLAKGPSYGLYVGNLADVTYYVYLCASSQMPEVGMYLKLYDLERFSEGKDSTYFQLIGPLCTCDVTDEAIVCQETPESAAVTIPRNQLGYVPYGYHSDSSPLQFKRFGLVHIECVEFLSIDEVQAINGLDVCQIPDSAGPRRRKKKGKS